MGLISRVSSRTYRNKMKYVAAYLLAAQSGSAPSKAAVTKILESIGADIEADKLFSELDGKSVEDVISEGMGLLASVPSGGAAPAAAAAGGDAAPAAEEKKESSEEEESDSDMGFDLFG